MVISLEEQRTIGPNEARRIGRSLLGGRFLERGTERIHRAPFDAALDGPILDAGEVDVATAVSTAVAGAKVAGALPVHSRVAIVERLADLVDRDSERLAATMTWQTGKPIRETRREVVRAADTLRDRRAYAGARALHDPSRHGDGQGDYQSRRRLPADGGGARRA